jgi:hypothetical protein
VVIKTMKSHMSDPTMNSVTGKTADCYSTSLSVCAI